MGKLADALDNLGLNNADLSEGGSSSVPDIMLEWANDLIRDLKRSLDIETSSGTSQALSQSIKAIPSRTAEQLIVEIVMLDYYDYINKGVEGVGGKKASGGVWSKKPTFGDYRFKKSHIKIDESLRQWSNAKNLSAHALSRSIAAQGIEGTLWYDKVVTEEVFEDLANRIGKKLGSGDNN